MYHIISKFLKKICWIYGIFLEWNEESLIIQRKNKILQKKVKVIKEFTGIPVDFFLPRTPGISQDLTQINKQMSRSGASIPFDHADI